MQQSNAIVKEIGQYDPLEARRFQVYTDRQIDKIDALKHLTEEQRFDIKVVASVLPFRVNQYVIDELIDWDATPDDPMFRLLFPQREMLKDNDYKRVADLLRTGADKKELAAVVNEIRARLNPHPAGQMELNMPRDAEGEVIDGIQHKYRETVLFFPSQGQTCHSYCTFCFRWAQFVGDKELRISSTEAHRLHDYLARHKDVSDLLITGGDPMIMKTRNMATYLNGITKPELDHIQTVRIGTKSLSFWPYRFVTDPDADDMLRLLKKTVNAGKHVAIMAHYNHWRELDTPIAHEAIRRLRDTGVEIRAQGPLLKNINDDADVWAKMWREQVRLGIIPYYMFVERDTGARHYFEVPLHQAVDIYGKAIRKVSGLARTARGPSMSAGPGKVEIQGTAEIKGEKVFVCRFIQGRNPEWAQRPFFAAYDENVTWMDGLKPAFGDDKFFFEDGYRTISAPTVSAVP